MRMKMVGVRFFLLTLVDVFGFLMAFRVMGVRGHGPGVGLALNRDVESTAQRRVVDLVS